MNHKIQHRGFGCPLELCYPQKNSWDNKKLDVTYLEHRDFGHFPDYFRRGLAGKRDFSSRTELTLD
jgi:hypothetical protein